MFGLAEGDLIILGLRIQPTSKSNAYPHLGSALGVAQNPPSCEQPRHKTRVTKLSDPIELPHAQFSSISTPHSFVPPQASGACRSLAQSEPCSAFRRTRTAACLKEKKPQLRCKYHICYVLSSTNVHDAGEARYGPQPARLQLIRSDAQLRTELS